MDVPAAAHPADPHPADRTADADVPATAGRSLTVLTALAALAAGACICLALPPWGWWPLAPIGVALFIWALGGHSTRARAGVGWLVGVAWFGPSTLWMFQLTAPGYVVGVLVVLGGMLALVAALFGFTTVAGTAG